MKKRVFLGFEGALPFLASEKILTEELSSSCPDLGQILMIMPGSFAIREFFRHLAQKVPDGLFVPEVMSQGSFLEKGRNLENAATEYESNILLARVLASCDHRKYPTLFTEEKAPSFSDAFYLSKMLFSFLKELSLGGMTLEDAIIRTPAIDPERRKEIRELEKLYHKELAAYGKVDRFSLLHFTLPQSRQEALEKKEELEEYKKIIVCAVPGLLPAVQARLERFADTKEVEIWIQAPSSMEEYFDEWGNPVPEKWENTAFEQGKDEETFFHTEKAADLAKLAVAVAARKGGLEMEKSAFACADASLMPFFKEELQNLGGKNIQFYDPSGVCFGRTRTGKLLSALIRFVRNNSFDSFRELVHHEDFLLYCCHLASVKENAFLAKLDTIFLEHLPEDPAALIPFADKEMKKVLEECNYLCAKMSSGSLPENLASILTDIYSIPCDRKDTENISFEAQCRHLEEFLKKCMASPVLRALEKEEFFSLLEEMCASDVLYGELASRRVELHGFLELPNLEAEELLLCGMSESFVPEKIDPNPFINDSQRLALGLPGNPQRAARDAFYLYESIARRRKKGGKVRFFASKFSADGTPARFSPFLFRGKRENMLSRASLLFSAPLPMPEQRQQESILPNDFYFRLPVEKYRNKLENIRISVTAFSTYLESPLHFFLKHIMKMEMKDYTAKEMDDAAFGNACHYVFESLKESQGRDIFSLQEKMRELLEKYLAENYGEKLSFLVDLQKDLILQRLYAAVPILLREEEKYSLLCQEYTLGGKKEEGGTGAIHFAGMDITGRIDRIEISKDKKVLRVLDFKTANSGIEPENAHCKGSGEKMEFLSLQLPLYAILLRKDAFFRKKYSLPDMEKMKIECGYFNLPKAVTSTGIKIWEDMEEILEKAEEKVQSIGSELQMMKEKLFKGDPDKKVKYDDFADLFQEMPSLVLRGVKFPDAAEKNKSKENPSAENREGGER
ncbi:MAG: PD-(D/E)XK nuclease family protein [Lentisphaeria bacterium]|nr:PD-(D/E)XK nuclease family protein [Lentisphaeria bacterium]